MSDSDLRDGERYFLRGCQAGGLSNGGFVWPLMAGAEVTAPDWDPTPECGRGLHGNLDGGGDSSMLVSGGVGLVVAARDAVDLEGKHKFQACRILFVGETLAEAATWLARRVQTPVHYGTSKSGDRGTSESGVGGRAKAGNGGIVAVRGYDGVMRCRPGDGKVWMLDSRDEWVEVSE